MLALNMVYHFLNVFRKTIVLKATNDRFSKTKLNLNNKFSLTTKLQLTEKHYEEPQ